MLLDVRNVYECAVGAFVVPSMARAALSLPPAMAAPCEALAPCDGGSSNDADDARHDDGDAFAPAAAVTTPVTVAQSPRTRNFGQLAAWCFAPANAARLRDARSVRARRARGVWAVTRCGGSAARARSRSRSIVMCASGVTMAHPTHHQPWCRSWCR